MTTTVLKPTVLKPTVLEPTVLEPTTLEPTTPDAARTLARHRVAPARIPMTRIVGVELRKMFDTRAGFWLMASILIASLLATAALIVFGSDDQLTFENFSTAIGAPMTVILPMIGILAVTSEWSQRSGLTTFTLIPHRGRVLGAKFIAALIVGIVAMLIALGVGSLGTVLGSAITGLDPVWNATVTDFALITLGSVLGMLFGFTLGVLIRNSAGAIVAYFVYTLVLPPLLGLLALSQQWFADLQPWVDYGFAQTTLFGGVMTSEQWQQLGVSGTLWFILPLAVGLFLIRRSEVK